MRNIDEEIGYLKALKDISETILKKISNHEPINEDSMYIILSKLSIDVKEKVNTNREKVDHFIQSISRNNEQKI